VPLRRIHVIEVSIKFVDVNCLWIDDVHSYRWVLEIVLLDVLVRKLDLFLRMEQVHRFLQNLPTLSFTGKGTSNHHITMSGNL
jgi:hypothetical protein